MVSAMSSLSPADPQQRASDAERDQVAAVLAEALATGRLTPAEHAERLELAYAAKTVGELAPLTRELPDVSPASAAVRGSARSPVAAVFSKVTRGGRWTVSRRTEIRAVMGALIVDLRDAEFPDGEVILDVTAFCGKLFVRLPRDAHVVDEGSALFSKRMVSSAAPESGAGPVVRLTGRALFSKVLILRGREDRFFDWTFDGGPGGCARD